MAPPAPCAELFDNMQLERMAVDESTSMAPPEGEELLFDMLHSVTFRLVFTTKIAPPKQLLALFPVSVHWLSARVLATSDAIAPPPNVPELALLLVNVQWVRVNVDFEVMAIAPPSALLPSVKVRSLIEKVVFDGALILKILLA